MGTAEDYYQSIKAKYPHLMEFDTRDDDPKPHIPVHFLLGASEWAAIKMPEGPNIGCPGDPIAEKTYLVSTIMSPGKELDHTHMLLTQTSQKTLR